MISNADTSEIHHIQIVGTIANSNDLIVLYAVFQAYFLNGFCFAFPSQYFADNFSGKFVVFDFKCICKSEVEV